MWSSACHKWVPLEPPYAPLQDEYGKLRITREGGQQVVLEDPRLEDVSLFGTGSDSEQVVAIPIDSVQKIERRGADTGGTVGLVVGIVGGLALIGLAAGGDMFEGWCAFGTLPSGECRPFASE